MGALRGAGHDVPLRRRVSDRQRHEPLQGLHPESSPTGRQCEFHRPFAAEREGLERIHLHTPRDQKKPSGAASAPCRTKGSAARLDAGPFLRRTLLRRWLRPLSGVDFRFAVRPAIHGRPLSVTDRSSRAHLPHALSSPDIGRIFGYRPGGDTHRGYHTQDSRICFLLRKQ